VRKEPAVLDDVADAQADGSGGDRGDRLIVEDDFTRVRLDEPDEQADEGGFAAPARADQDGGSPDWYLQREWAEGGAPGVNLPDVFQ
jgi:hypothetical protein